VSVLVMIDMVEVMVVYFYASCNVIVALNNPPFNPKISRV